MLVIESPQIFGRAAAAPDDDDIYRVFDATIADGLRVMLIEQFDGAGYLDRRAFALHARGRKEHVNRARAARDDVQDVADGRARRRGDDADAARKQRERTLSSFVKQSFPRQPLFHLLEGDAQRPGPDRVERFDHQLIFTARLVDGEATARSDLQAVRRTKAYRAVRAAKTGRAQLRRLVTNREIPVAGSVRLKVGNLALDPHRSKAALKRRAHLHRQLRHRERTPLRFIEQ